MVFSEAVYPCGNCIEGISLVFLLASLLPLAALGGVGNQDSVSVLPSSYGSPNILPPLGFVFVEY